MSGTTPHTRRLKLLDERGQVVGEKEVVLYRGLLELVHEQRLHEIHTELVQAPSKDNGETAIVRAMVRTARGTFTGIGDANPRNVDPKVAPHFIRMAETRAEARAMRKALCIGIVSFEEFGADADVVLDDRDEVRAHSSSGGSSFDHHRTPPRAMGQSLGNMRRDHGATRDPTAHASDNQRRFLYRLLSQRGKTGDEARAFIHQALGVTSLEEAPKHAVSALIDSLKSENENGRHRDNGHANGNGRYRENGTHG